MSRPAPQAPGAAVSAPEPAPALTLAPAVPESAAAHGARESIQVHLTEVNDTVASLQPWVRYEFASPAFEALSAGQKIMLRVGSVNQRWLKAKLTAIRQQLIKRVATRQRASGRQQLSLSGARAFR